MRGRGPSRPWSLRLLAKLPGLGDRLPGDTIAGVQFLTTAGERSVASSWMSTNLGQNRYAQEALFVLRNRVQSSGSTGTVFHPDDSTSAWTFSVTTGTDPLSGIDPGGL